MVFLIQNTQNRDAKAIHLKLDELIRSLKGARTGLVDLESLTDEELDLLQTEFRELRLKQEQINGGLEELKQAVEQEQEERMEEERTGAA